METCFLRPRTSGPEVCTASCKKSQTSSELRNSQTPSLQITKSASGLTESQ